MILGIEDKKRQFMAFIEKSKAIARHVLKGVQKILLREFKVLKESKDFGKKRKVIILHTLHQKQELLAPALARIDQVAQDLSKVEEELLRNLPTEEI